MIEFGKPLGHGGVANEETMESVWPPPIPPLPRLLDYIRTFGFGIEELRPEFSTFYPTCLITKAKIFHLT